MRKQPGMKSGRGAELRRKVTAAEVAAKAGVSQSAVSRYFTPGASVSKKTAALVRDAAEALGYRPNVVARSLITGRSHVVGLIVAYLENQYYPHSIELIAKHLKARGYNLQIFISSLDATDAHEIVENILECQLEGIIAASVTLTSDIVSRCQDLGVPIVLFNRSQDGLFVSSVTSDNMLGGYRVAQHLVEQGCRRIAYIAGLEETSTQRDREAGFLRGLRDAGLELYARGQGQFSAAVAADATRRMFTAEQIPDAVFVANDHMALAALDVLRHELGISVPETVAVVGYDDITPASWASYELTTIRQMSERMAEKTVELLIGQIEHRTLQIEKVQIDGPLIVRQTSDRKGSAAHSARTGFVAATEF